MKNTKNTKNTKKQNINNKKYTHDYCIKEILFIIALFYIPILLNPSLPSTISILKTPLEIFRTIGVYGVIINFLLNSVFIIGAILILNSESIKINYRTLLSDGKRTFLHLFIGYFIYLFFLISILVQKSINIQTSKGMDIIDIVYTLCAFSFILVVVIIYSIRNKIYFGSINIGSFILLLLGSAILFETFIGFSPLQTVFGICFNYEIVDVNIKIQFMVPYYFSILSSIILSIIDYRYFKYS